MWITNMSTTVLLIRNNMSQFIVLKKYISTFDILAYKQYTLYFIAASIFDDNDLHLQTCVYRDI